MSNLSEYIEKVREYILQNNFNEIEVIRYIYLDLGKRFSFNLDFLFGNSKIQKQIYKSSGTQEYLNESMKTNIGICKTIAYIVDYVLNELGISCTTSIELYDDANCPHMYNIVILKNGRRFSIDLQNDLKNIQSHSCTEKFGLSTEENIPPVIQRFELEQIDRKLGYIDNENYYSDDYLYLLKSDIGYFTNFAEKVEFILNNIDIHENKEIKYSERKWHHKQILKKLFSEKELRKIHMIDCYKYASDKREYKECIIVERGKGIDVYMYLTDELKYNKISIEELAKQVKMGLVCMQGVQGLKQAVKELEERELEE